MRLIIALNLLLLSLISGCKSKPSLHEPPPFPGQTPSRLRTISTTTVDDRPILEAVLHSKGHLGFAAYWVNPGTNAYWVIPPTNIWLCEWSTNLVTWHYCGNETVLFTNGFRFTKEGPRFTETGTSWTRAFFIRLRRAY